MKNEGFSKERYLKEVAQKLRQVEAERIRGDLIKLEELEHTTDATLLRKWGWISAIVGAIFSFFILPLIIGLVQHFLSEWLSQFLWAIAKVSMGMSLLMFAASVYITIKLPD